MRILLSEGSSTSAREAVTALGVKGHHVEICDPDPRCFARFSRFVKRYHPCPGLRDRPIEFLDFVVDLVSRESFDVLLPIHEQGFLFAAAIDRIAPHVAIALPSFRNYRRAHSKAGFHDLLTELGLPEPPTRIVHSAQELREAVKHFPCEIKAEIGTASRDNFLARSRADVEKAATALEENGSFADRVLVQDFAKGAVEHSQAVFFRGELIAMHAVRQIARGQGGGDAIKESVSRPQVEEHMRAMGRALDWHGAWSLDYILTESGPEYIDSNPRLVEPMGAQLCGLDLADLLLEISLDRRPASARSGEGIRTHLAMQALLGVASRTESRGRIMAEARHLIAKDGRYRGSHEELTPVRVDWVSAGPLLATVVLLLTDPTGSSRLAKGGWGSHLLTPQSIKIIEEHFPSNRHVR